MATQPNNTNLRGFGYSGQLFPNAPTNQAAGQKQQGTSQNSLPEQPHLNQQRTNVKNKASYLEKAGMFDQYGLKSQCERQAEQLATGFESDSRGIQSIAVILNGMSGYKFANVWTADQDKAMNLYFCLKAISKMSPEQQYQLKEQVDHDKMRICDTKNLQIVLEKMKVKEPETSPNTLEMSKSPGI